MCDEDTLYRHVINRLKAQGKIVHSLLSLEEIPSDFEVEIGKFAVEKHPTVRSESQIYEQNGSAIPKDWTETADYDSDRYSVIDANDHMLEC